MIETVGNEDKLKGFIIGFACNIPQTPSNESKFSEGFYEGKQLVKELEM